MQRPRGRGARWVAVVAAFSGCEQVESTPEAVCFIEYEPEPQPEPLHPEPTPCDPREPPERSPRIQPPVLVGEHPDGTVYVLDREDDGLSWVDSPAGQDLSPRLFVSSGHELIEQDGGGGWYLANTYIWGGFGASGGSVRGRFRLGRNRDRKHIDPREAKMALQETEPELSREELGAQGLSDEEVEVRFFEQLTPLRVRSECAVEEFEPVFLPQGPRRVAYVAEDERGHHILVTEPARHFDAYDFKVFYGPPEGVVERPTAEPVSRERDGGTTTIRFKVDGEAAELYFPAPRREDLEPSITLSGEVSRITVLSDVTPEQALPAGMTYICHDQVY